MKEKIIETKQCKKCNISFDITDKDLEFYDKVSPIFNGEKHNIPTPILCPDCRQQRRLSFRNERMLYKRKCDATGEDIISIYSPDKPYKVYNQDFWWSDKWDAMDYGIDFDFSRGFFKQSNILVIKVPVIGLLQNNSENSDYVNDSFFNKNCYLCFTSWEVEDSFYSNNIFWSKSCSDVFWTTKSEQCYNSIYINNCKKLFYSNYCYDSIEGYYLSFSIGCSNCSFSIGLINSSYYFLNKNYTKNKYNSLISKSKNNKLFLKECIVKYNKLLNNYKHKSIQGIKFEKCTGNFISDSFNSSYIFDVENISNSKYIYQGGHINNSMDLSITGSNKECGLNYEGLSIAGSNNSKFSITCWDSNNIIYSQYCFNSSNLFGCIGLINKQYCILNKQYLKEEYNKLVPKIIEKMKIDGEWGEFFPVNLSSFGYNETVAQEYFPIEKDEAIKNNFNWSDYKSPAPNVKKVIPANKLPDDISDIPDDILNWAIECEETKKPFRIIKEELEFYRKHNLPIPKKHPDQRHLDRMKLRNPRKLYDRDCDKCGVIMKTTYSPDREEIVYCEKCYNEEVY